MVAAISDATYYHARPSLILFSMPVLRKSPRALSTFLALAFTKARTPLLCADARRALGRYRLWQFLGYVRGMLHSKYLIDVLEVLEEGKVALETTTPSSPGVIRPVVVEDGAESMDDYVHVVMPMFVQW